VAGKAVGSSTVALAQGSLNEHDLVGAASPSHSIASTTGTCSGRTRRSRGRALAAQGPWAGGVLQLLRAARLCVGFFVGWSIVEVWS